MMLIIPQKLYGYRANKIFRLDSYKNVYFVVLKEHEEIFKFQKGLSEELEVKF